MSKDDPAFPVPPFTAPGGDFVWPYNGLTKREYFIAAALAGILSREGSRNTSHEDSATAAISRADALIAELNK